MKKNLGRSRRVNSGRNGAMIGGMTGAEMIIGTGGMTGAEMITVIAGAAAAGPTKSQLKSRSERGSERKRYR